MPETAGRKSDVRNRSANITSMPLTAEEERAARMRKYTLMMIVRVLCLLALLWVRGPLMFVFAAGAIFLPYFAVVVANAIRSRGTPPVERPGLGELPGPGALYPPEEWFEQSDSDEGGTRGAP